jgi:hypothetical protein
MFKANPICFDTFHSLIFLLKISSESYYYLKNGGHTQV